MEDRNQIKDLSDLINSVWKAAINKLPTVSLDSFGGWSKTDLDKQDQQKKENDRD